MCFGHFAQLTLLITLEPHLGCVNDKIHIVVVLIMLLDGLRH